MAMATPQRLKGRRRADLYQDYEGFTEKFKPKKTTDDCYTPREVYETVLSWVDSNLHPLGGVIIRRQRIGAMLDRQARRNDEKRK